METVKYSVFKGSDMTPAQWQAVSSLFSSECGVYSPSSPVRAGLRVRLGVRYCQRNYASDDYRVALCYDGQIRELNYRISLGDVLDLGHVDAESMDLGALFRGVLRKTDDGNFVKPRKMRNHIVVATSRKSPLKGSQKMPRKILSTIHHDPFIGTHEMADLIVVERNTVARAIAKQKSSGRLRRVGPDKGGHSEILKEDDT